MFVDIFTPQCGPCCQLAPVLDELAAEFNGRVTFVKMNAVADAATTQLCGELGVRSVPTLLIFQSGTEKSRRMGLASKTELASWIEESIKA